MLRRTNSVISNPGIAQKPDGAVDIVEAQRRHNRAQSVGAYSLEKGVLPTGIDVSNATPQLKRSDSDYSSGSSSSDDGAIKSIGMPIEETLVKGEKSAAIKSLEQLHFQLDNLIESFCTRDCTKLHDLELIEKEVSGITAQLDTISIFVKSQIDDLDYEKQVAAQEDGDYIPMAPAPVTTAAADAIQADKFKTLTPKAGAAVLAAIQSGHYNVPRKAVSFSPLMPTVYEFGETPPETPVRPGWMRITEI